MNPNLPENHQDADTIAENYDNVKLSEISNQLCPMCENYMTHAEALDGWNDTVDILECEVCGYQDLPKE